MRIQVRAVEVFENKTSFQSSLGKYKPLDSKLLLCQDIAGSSKLTIAVAHSLF